MTAPYNDESVVIWLRDDKTGLQCGINAEGDLYLSNESTGYSLKDSKENRKEIIREFCKQTGQFKPTISEDGSPVEKITEFDMIHKK